MFKRIKESEKYQRFKELWANEKTHSMMVLALWLVFFIIVVLFVRFSAPTPTSNNTVNSVAGTDFDKISSYSFNAASDNVVVNGVVYNDKMEFILNNQRYYVDNGVYLIDGDKAIKQDFDLSFLKIDVKMLDNLLSGLTGTEKDDSPGGLGGFKGQQPVRRPVCHLHRGGVKGGQQAHRN